jgi:hypothetical protein
MGEDRLMAVAAFRVPPSAVDVDDAGSVASVKCVVLASTLGEHYHLILPELDDEVAVFQSGCPVRQWE